MLAIGIIFESAYTASIEIDHDDKTYIVEQLTYHMGDMPDQILLIKNDLVIEHWNC
jgi:hypothetical protein